jgi:hypothetical protein
MKIVVARSFAACLVVGSLGCGPQVDSAGADESGSSSGGDTGVSTGLVTSATLTQGPVSDTVPPSDDTANTVDTAETAPPGDTTSAVASTSGDTSGETSDDGATSVGSTEAASSTGAADACGDGEVGPGEQCDGDELDGWTCGALGLGPGRLACEANCTFDTSKCDPMGAGCGDGIVQPGEQCDGDRLQGFDCASLGLSGGTLGCDPITCTFDTSMCTGNGGGTSG